jgi:hypothetical protein
MSLCSTLLHCLLIGCGSQVSLQVMKTKITFMLENWVSLWLQRRTVLLEKLIFAQLVKKMSTSCGTFLAVLTRGRYWSIFWTTYTQSTSTDPSFKTNFKNYPQIYAWLQSGLFPSSFPTTRTTCPSNVILNDHIWWREQVIMQFSPAITLPLTSFLKVQIFPWAPCSQMPSIYVKINFLEFAQIFTRKF